SLFLEGKNKICSKIAEEALEVMQAEKKETKQRLIEESSDLLYHLFVLLAEKKISLEDIAEELKKRNSK
ncbi:MAG: phosphoribosyl-ATP diphosphatase, partial [Candidatus Gracilibacteria bacterium]|nr:phosphoribosyl-ATP diphosphatase [Candidatus Gracilibacteria bacterium]